MPKPTVHSVYSSFESRPLEAGTVCPHCFARITVSVDRGFPTTAVCYACCRGFWVDKNETISIEMLSSSVPIPKGVSLLRSPPQL